MNSRAPASLQHGHQGEENLRCCSSARCVLSVGMCNHSSYCLLIGLLNISGHPSKPSHGQWPHDLYHSSGGAEGNGHQEWFTAKRRQWLPRVPPLGLALGPRATQQQAQQLLQPHLLPWGIHPVAPNRLLGVGSTMAINKFLQRSAGFRLTIKMGGEEKLGILQPSTNHVPQRTL